MDLGITATLVLFGLSLLGLYHYLTSRFDFWKKINVPGPRPLPFFGNYKDVILGKSHACVLFKKIFDRYPNEPFIGIFVRNTPTLLLKNPDLIKDFLIKDFHVFSDRGFSVNEKSELLDQNLFVLKYDQWRPLRQKLSPAFTSGKLREMIYLMEDCADIFERYLEKVAVKNEPLEFRELTARFTTQTIGVCAFGVDTKAIEDETSEFRKYGRALFEPGYLDIFKDFLRHNAPKLAKLLGSHKRSDSIKFLIKSIKETVIYRKKNNVERNDFVDIMMSLEEQFDKIEDFVMFMSAQALVFFAAGFETSSTTMSNTFYELALNPEIQDKVRADILRELAVSKGKLTYDNIKSMKYLDKVVKESLRKHPPGTFLQRKSLTPYTFAGTTVTIPKGVDVYIPIYTIHRDPNVYPDPEKFDPERFDEVNVQNRHPMSYLPFGDGPHNCIGSRFANYQTKIGIITVLKNYKLSVCEKTHIPYRIKARSRVPAPVGGVYLTISKV